MFVQPSSGSAGMCLIVFENLAADDASIFNLDKISFSIGLEFIQRAIGNPESPRLRHTNTLRNQQRMFLRVSLFQTPFL